MSFATQVRAAMAPPPPPPPRIMAAAPPPPPPPPPPFPTAITTPLVLDGIGAALDGPDLAGVLGLTLQASTAIAKSRPVIEAARRRIEEMDGCGGPLSWFAEGHPRPELDAFRERWATFDLGESPL